MIYCETCENKDKCESYRKRPKAKWHKLIGCDRDKKPKN